jgi:hypothetical protein
VSTPYSAILAPRGKKVRGHRTHGTVRIPPAQLSFSRKKPNRFCRFENRQSQQISLGLEKPEFYRYPKQQSPLIFTLHTLKDRSAVSVRTMQELTFIMSSQNFPIGAFCAVLLGLRYA